MQRDIQILMEMLRCSAEGTEIDEKIISDITSGILHEIYTITNIHGLTHLLGNIIDKCDIPGDDTLVKILRTQVLDAVFSYEKLNYETEQISDVFEKNEIPFVFLKGPETRKFYSQPWLRTSCDIDILVHKSDLVRAGDFFESELGYKKVFEGTHHITYLSSGDVNIELHFALIEKNQANKASKIADKIWDYAKVQVGYQYRFILDDDFFYFYHIAHSATHFESGGCGIKPVLDLYLMSKKINCKTMGIKRLLSKSGLTDFEYYFRKLSEVWFSGEKHTEVTRLMENFIINGGLTGTKKQNLLMRKHRTNGKKGYILSRIFIPLEELKKEFPILKKMLFLFPVMGIIRWFKLLFKKEKSEIIRRYEIVKNIPEKDMKIYGEMFEKIGL